MKNRKLSISEQKEICVKSETQEGGTYKRSYVPKWKQSFLFYN